MTRSLLYRTAKLGALCFLLLALPLWAKAGNGTFKNGRYNFCVSVRFNASSAQLTQIRTAFENASQILADATNGQHRFGTITIVNDSGASQSADYWVKPEAGRAFATLGKYGVRGEHVTLFFPSDFQGLHGGADGDAYTIAHEHSHHSFGVVDEYSGPGFLGLFTVDAECAAPPNTATTSFCLMDNFFNLGGRAFGGGYTLNEFCVSSNHDPDRNTYQHSTNHQSCWETIASHPKRSAAAPAGLPTDAPPAAHTLSFNTGIGGLRVMLVIDRSGSMGVEQRLELAKQSAKLFVNFLKPGDSIGVTSFDCSTAVDFPLTTIANNSTKDSAKAAIDGITLGGSTNIGGGVLTALSQITAQTDRSCNEIIVLLTDGDHNCGTDPGSAVSPVQDAGVTVLAVGIGAGISTSGQAALQNLASQTSGKYFNAGSSFDLIGLYLQLLLESREFTNGLLTRAPLSIQSGQLQEIQVPVEAGVASAIFGIGIVNSTDNLTLSLRTPSGVEITQASAAGNPNIEFNAEPNSKAFQILAPEAGVWTIRITAGAVTNGNLEVFASAEHDGVQLGVSVTKDTLNFPDVAQVQAAPTFGGERVVGATVSGNVLRPDGSRVAITLSDDGSAEYGDAVVGDGIYSARFSQYNVSGTYTFELTVINNGGMTFAGESLFSFSPSNAKAVPGFTRRGSATVVLMGVVQGADASIMQSAAPSSVITGANLTYTLTVTNNGPVATTNVVVTDNLPTTTSFVSCTATGGGICGGTGSNRTVTFASLASGTSATITLVAQVDCVVADNVVINNTATVSTATTDPNGNNNSASAIVTASNPAPVIAPVANVSVGTTGNSAVVNYALPNVTDNCPVANAVCTPAPGFSFPLGTTTVNCTVTDSGNRTATSSFTVTANKVGVPTLSDPLVCTGPGNVVSVTFVLTNNAAVPQNVEAVATLPPQLLALPGSCTVNVGGCNVESASTVRFTGTLAAGQIATVSYQTQIADGTLPGTQLCANTSASFGGGPPLMVQACTTVNCPPAGPGAPFPARSEVNDQKAGSVLVYNIYTSGSDPTRQNTRISITNTNPALPIAVHLFFVDGATCSVADATVCLTPNQTSSFLASDLDPGTTGYIVAIASDPVTGCPVNFNFLIGDEYVKFATGHAANLGAEAFAALAGGLTFCNQNSVTAQLNFDGVSYNRVPRALALDNIPSRADGNDTLLILNRFGGNLGIGAGTLINLFGILYNDTENSVSFGFGGASSSPGTCQFRSSLSNNFPRVTPRFEQFIPAGSSGWMRLYSQSDIGLLGAALTFNPDTGANGGAFTGGHNLHKLTLTSAMVLTIPVFPPSC